MKYFFDTEFLEDGKTIDLISIGIVAEDGRTFYAISTEFDTVRAVKHEWLNENVLAKLPYRGASCWMSREAIANNLIAFIGNDPDPEFWADFGAYDWVALCQLFGTMMDLPKGWPMFVRDIQPMRKLLKLPKVDFIVPGMEGQDHHALYDALECKMKWEWINEAWTRLLETEYKYNDTSR